MHTPHLCEIRFGFLLMIFGMRELWRLIRSASAATNQIDLKGK